MRLPCYHCEIIPIELVWSQFKRHVAKYDTKFKKVLMVPLIDDAFIVEEKNSEDLIVTLIEKVEDNM